MAVQGPFVWFDRAIQKIADGTILLNSHTFHAALCASSQALTATFVGSSTDARYADLTGELTTAAGYTAGGVAMTTVALARVGANEVKWSADPPAWTLTGGGITFKYVVLVDWTATNKDLLGYCDMDTGGGSVSPIAGALSIQPDATNGFLYWYQ